MYDLSAYSKTLLNDQLINSDILPDADRFLCFLLATDPEAYDEMKVANE